MSTITIMADMPLASKVGDDAATFLRTVFANKPKEQYLLLWEKLNSKTSFWSQDVEEAAEYAAAHHVNLYAGVALSQCGFGPYKRCAANNTSGLMGFYADIDIAGLGHDAENLPPDKEAALSVLPPEFRPSIIIDTGHGIQAWWLFSIAWMFENADDRQRAMDAAQQWHGYMMQRAAAHGWKLDAVFDLARVFRVPGTTNRKKNCPDAEARIISITDARYASSDFADVLAADYTAVFAASKSKKKKTRQQAERVEHRGHDDEPRSDQRPPLDAASGRLQPSPYWLFGSAMERIQDGEGRNDTGLWLCCQCRDNRYSMGQAAVLGPRYVKMVTDRKDHPYTLEEFNASLRSAYGWPPRDGWGFLNEGDSWVVSAEGLVTELAAISAGKLPWLFEQDIGDGADDARDSADQIAEAEASSLADQIVEGAASTGAVVGADQMARAACNVAGAGVEAGAGVGVPQDQIVEAAASAGARDGAEKIPEVGAVVSTGGVAEVGVDARDGAVVSAGGGIQPPSPPPRPENEDPGIAELRVRIAAMLGRRNSNPKTPANGVPQVDAGESVNEEDEDDEDGGHQQAKRRAKLTPERARAVIRDILDLDVARVVKHGSIGGAYRFHLVDGRCIDIPKASTLTWQRSFAVAVVDAIGLQIRPVKKERWARAVDAILSITEVLETSSDSEMVSSWLGKFFSACPRIPSLDDPLNWAEVGEAMAGFRSYGSGYREGGLIESSSAGRIILSLPEFYDYVTGRCGGRLSITDLAGHLSKLGFVRKSTIATPTVNGKRFRLNRVWVVARESVNIGGDGIAVEDV